MLSGEIYLSRLFKSARSFCLFSAKVEALKTFSRFESLRGQLNTIGTLEMENKEQTLANIPSQIGPLKAETNYLQAY